MRDWAIVIAAPALIIYFVAQPEQFATFMQFVQQIIR